MLFRGVRALSKRTTVHVISGHSVTCNLLTAPKSIVQSVWCFDKFFSVVGLLLCSEISQAEGSSSSLSPASTRHYHLQIHLFIPNPHCSAGVIQTWVIGRQLLGDTDVCDSCQSSISVQTNEVTSCSSLSDQPSDTYDDLPVNSHVPADALMLIHSASSVSVSGSLPHSFDAATSVFRRLVQSFVTNCRINSNLQITH